MSIYKPCDIRGCATRELTPELYRGWGRGLGVQVGPKAKFVVGGDVRTSTPPFLAALVEGLCEVGVDVVDLGTLPTPMVYYAKRRLSAAGCAIVTASHNPPGANGLKWMIGDQPPSEDDIRALDQPAEQTTSPHPDPLPRGEGTRDRPLPKGEGTKGPKAESRNRKAGTRTPRSDGEGTQARNLDVSFDYVAWLQEVWFDTPPLGQPIVLDTMHGAWACRARRYLQAVFPRTVFVAIHDTPNGAFDGRSPDCSLPDRLEDLAEAVYHHRACLGIAMDGDGDRVAFVDDEGNTLSAEEATWVLLQSFGPALPGERFIYDLKFSDRVPEAARQLGAEPLVERSGHTFVRGRMLRTGARFGAETNGHYYFRDLEGGDDGLFAACWMISYLAQSPGTSLAQRRRECPPVFMTPDLRVPLETTKHAAVIAKVRRAWRKYPQSEIDGVRVDFPTGWALVRGSGAEPALSFRFEAGDWDGLGELVHRFCDGLAEVGKDLWATYHQAMGCGSI